MEKDSLNIKEVELFKAVDCWAEKECEKQGLVAEGSVKRRILGERVVKAIRFPVMEEKDFVVVVLDCNILTQKECFDLMKYFNSVLKMPVGFPENSRAGYLRVVSRFRALGNGWEYRGAYPGNGIILSVNRNIKLHTVRLFGSENSEYSVNLTVTVSGSGVVVATKNGNFLSKHIRCEFGDYQGYDIMIEPPITLAANTDYTFYANISGPPSWYG